MNYKKVGRNERSNFDRMGCKHSTFKLLVLSGEATGSSTGDESSHMTIGAVA